MATLQSPNSVSSTRQAVIACAQTLVFGLYPLLLALRVSLGLPLRDEGVGRTALVALGVTAILVWVLKVLNWNLTSRATWLSWVLALFGFYTPAIAASRAIGARVYIGHPGFSLGYVLFSMAAAALIVQPWKPGPKDTVPLSITAAILLALSGYPFVEWLLNSKTGEGIREADRMVADVSRRQAPGPSVDADVYYIVLDGFGRSDVLNDYYGEPLTSFRAYLASRGFYVAEQAQSNYSQTILSLSSFLNMSYLDEVATVLGKGSTNRLPLAHLIQQNALMKAAKESGYRVIAIGSDYMATKRLDSADVCYCRQYGLGEFAQATIGVTPFAALPLGRWTYQAHRQKVLRSFAALDEAMQLPGRKFVFAHIVAPHPPFVFAADGGFEAVYAGPGLFNDGDTFGGEPSEYVPGYRRQAQFIATQMQTVVDHLLSRAGPASAIVIHGDHGPGSMMRWNDPQATNMRERMGIFAAYHFPRDGNGGLYPTITPVNGARLLANGYFGTDLPMLPDRSYFSTWEQPLDFVPASGTERSSKRE